MKNFVNIIVLLGFWIGGMDFGYCQSRDAGTVHFVNDFKTADHYTSMKLASIAALMINMRNTDIVETSDTMLKFDSETIYVQYYDLKTGDQCLPFVVEYGKQFNVSHMGIRLFNHDKHFYENPVLAAVERLLLEVSLIEISGSRANDFFENEGIKIRLNSETLGSMSIQKVDDIKPIMGNPDAFNMKWKDYQFALRWEQKSQVVEWIIPARAELITGLDKRELDTALTDKMLRIVPSDQDNESDRVNIREDQSIRLNSGIWLERGKIFIEGVTQNRFFRKNETELSLLFSQEFFTESIQNLLLDTTRAVYAAPVQLTIKTLKARRLFIEYHDLLEFFSRECEVYAGLETLTGDSVQAIVIFEDRQYNHIHLLSLKVPHTFIAGRGRQDLSGKLYLNIRRDNVESIFARETVDKEGQIFQIRLK